MIIPRNWHQKFKNVKNALYPVCSLKCWYRDIYRDNDNTIFLPRMLFKMLIQDKSPLTKSTSIIMKIKMFFFYTFLARLRRKKVELLSSLRRQRLGRLSFLSESISQKLSKVSIWNLEYLFTIKRGTNYNKADDPVICISRVICPCFDIVHRN
jgi:hypothetical protein